MGMKIREAMQGVEQNRLLAGLIEMDETYIGGKPRKKHPDDKHPRGSGTAKTPVVGMVERGGKVKAKPMNKKDINFPKLLSLVRNNVVEGKSTLMTDEARYYQRFKYYMPHATVRHDIWYVDEWKHTNTIECFWALLKRGIIGQFHKVSFRYLQHYIDEFAYRFNHRDAKGVFDLTIKRAVS
jgi:hypothetical protein